MAIKKIEDFSENTSPSLENTYILTSTNNVTEKVKLSKAIETKVDAIEGKVLSDNNYTTTEKNKLASLSTETSGQTPDRKSVVLDDFQTEDWTHQSGTGTMTWDTSDFMAGTKSLKLVTAGGGTGVSDYVYKNISFTKNSEKTVFFEIDVKVTNASHVSRLYVQLYSSVSENKYRTAQLEATGRKNVPEADWVTFKAAMHCFDPSGTETIDTIGDTFERIRFQFSDDGTPVTFNIGGIRMVEVPKKAYVLFTFDDSNKSVYTKAMPIMEKYGIKGTSFNIKENIGYSAQYMTITDLKVLEKLGWCNGIHGQSPTDDGWANLTEEQFVKYVSDSQNYWKENDITSGLDVAAYPNGNFGGDYDGYIYRVAKKFFRIARGTNTGATEPFPECTDPLVLHTGKKLYFGAVDKDTINSYLQRLSDEGGLGILVGHDIVDSSASGNDVLTTDFQSVVEKVATLQSEGTIVPITMSELRDMMSSRSVEKMTTALTYIGYNNATGTDADVQSANRAWFREVVVDMPIKVSYLCVAVTAQAGNICLGLYNEAGTLIATTGSVACPSVGAAYIAVTSPVIIQKGRYYLAIVADTITTCKFRETATILLAGGYRKDTFFPLASLSGRVDAETYADGRAFAICAK